jgi:hypothetical protein
LRGSRWGARAALRSQRQRLSLRIRMTRNEQRNRNDQCGGGYSAAQRIYFPLRKGVLLPG